MKLQKIFLTLCCLIMASGIALAQKVSVTKDPASDFSQYKTYAWGPENHKAGNPMTDQAITEGIDAQLASHGLTKVQDNLESTRHVPYGSGSISGME